jgi:hypothetical protein
MGNWYPTKGSEELTQAVYDLQESFRCAPKQCKYCKQQKGFSADALQGSLKGVLKICCKSCGRLDWYEIPNES